MKSTVKRIHNMFRYFALALLAVLVATPAVHAGVIDDAQAYWTFDSNLTDSSGSGATHHGTSVGGALITNLAGEFVFGGGALSLDGTDDYVSFAEIPLSGAFSVSAWINPDTLSGATVVGDASNADWIRVDGASVTTKLSGASGVATSISSSFVIDQWQHFVLTRDGSNNMTIFRNTLNVGSESRVNNFTPEHIGHKFTGGASENFYNGLIDEVGIWDRVLSTSEISELFNGPPPPVVPEPSSLSLLLIGSLVFRLFGRRRRCVA